MRDGVPLVWSDSGDRRVIFDNLERAKTAALLHAIEQKDRLVGYDALARES
jgi:hypothetical protein